MSEQSTELEPRSWFDGKQIILLRQDGDRKFYGVRDEDGEVISRVELLSDAAEARQKASTAWRRR